VFIFNYIKLGLAMQENVSIEEEVGNSRVQD